MKIPKPYNVITKIDGIEIVRPQVVFGRYDREYIDPTTLSADQLAGYLNAAYQSGARDVTDCLGKAVRLFGCGIEQLVSKSGAGDLANDACAILKELE